jgi:hypothetical protein
MMDYPLLHILHGRTSPIPNQGALGPRMPSFGWHFALKGVDQLQVSMCGSGVRRFMSGIWLLPAFYWSVIF